MSHPPNPKEPQGQAKWNDEWSAEYVLDLERKILQIREQRDSFVANYYQEHEVGEELERVIRSTIKKLDAELEK